MKTIRRLWGRGVGFWRRKQAEEGLRAEIEAHLEMEAEALEAQGMEPARAREEARRRFGHVEGLKEQCREQGRLLWLERWGRDMAHSARSLLRLKGYSLSVILVLALGIASLTTVLDIAQQLLHPRKPFPEAERVMELRAIQGPNSYFILQQSQYLEMRSKEHSCFERFAAYVTDTVNLVIDGVPYPQRLVRVTPGFFAVCRTQPLLGRLPTEEEWRRADDSVVLISHGVWGSRFAHDPEILGKKIEVAGKPCVVVGVLPKEFYAPPRGAGGGWDLIVPGREELRGEKDQWDPVFVHGLARKGVSLEQMRAELSCVSFDHLRISDVQQRLHVEPIPIYSLYLIGDPVVIWCMLGAALLLHGIALINAGTLLVMRLRTRQRELGVRVALGCSRAWVRHLVFSELALLGLGALVPAMLLAQWAGSAWVDYVDHWWFGLLNYQPLSLLYWVLPVWGGSLVLLALVCMWRVVSADPAKAFREGLAVAGHSRTGRRLLDGVVVLQAALAVALLAGAGLMLKSLDHLRAKSLGFDTHRKIAVSGTLPLDRTVSSSAKAFELYLLKLESLRQALCGLPEVEAAEIADTVPLNHVSIGTLGVNLSVEGGAVAHNAIINGVSVDFLRRMGIRLVRGSLFAEARKGEASVVVLSESCASKLFGQQDPIGRFVDMGDTSFFGDYEIQPPRRVAWRVVGVVADVCVFGQRTPPVPMAYYPYWQRPLWMINVANFMVKTRIDTDARFEESIRKVLYPLEPRATVSTLRLEMEQVWKLNNERNAYTLLRVLSGLAVVLTLAGVYSVMSYSVQQRQREFGVRIALGARAEDLRNAVLWRGGLLAGLGIVIGLGLAWYLSRFMTALLFEVGTFDLWVYLSVGSGLFAVALVSSWLPARRALRIDPVESLRAE